MKALRFVYIISIFLATSCAKDIVDLTGDIKGTVKDYKTGELISNCGVSLSPGGKSTSTNQYGEFSFNDLDYHFPSQDTMMRPKMLPLLQVKFPQPLLCYKSLLQKLAQ